MKITLQIVEKGKPISICYPNKQDHQFQYVTKNNLLYEFHYLRYIHYVGKILNFKSAYDIGVCFANHSVYFGSLMGCSVNAFEPNFDLYEIIEHNLCINSVNYKLHKFALGDKNINGYLNKHIDNIGSSYITYNNDDVANNIKVATLDKLISNCSIERPCFIKIDTEGHEIKVIKGAFNILSDELSPDVFVEIHEEQRDEMFKIMKDLGYRFVVRIGKNYHFSKRVNLFMQARFILYAFYCKMQKELFKVWGCGNKPIISH